MLLYIFLSIINNLSLRLSLLYLFIHILRLRIIALFYNIGPVENASIIGEVVRIFQIDGLKISLIDHCIYFSQERHNLIILLQFQQTVYFAIVPLIIGTINHYSQISINRTRFIQFQLIQTRSNIAIQNRSSFMLRLRNMHQTLLIQHNCLNKLSTLEIIIGLLS